MNKSASSIYDMSPLKLALAAREMKGNLTLMRAEPIAVIGMGCRLPGGADSPEAFWRMLEDGIDAVGEIPPGRWDVDAFYDPDPAVPGKMYCRHGSFIKDIDGFDARLFAVSPREAAAMDPQQRILMETAWAAVHDAGLDAETLYGSRTGVYVGISTSDYAALQMRLQNPARIDPYYVSGTVLSVAAGRLSYALGLKGPSMALDTACSSSLVAVHQACESLRRRECDLALTGGVGLMMAPEPGISFCKAGLLSPDGRCKSFDAGADGYGRGEGCGVLVLKRLSDALADDDFIQALIRGSAVNQDGASGGLTVPSGPSQEAVIRAALADSGIFPDQVGYIEAHGTGTSLGDPIEMEALGNVFPVSERATPLVVGSVKTNFGHLEAAAGVAGMIKLVLTFQHKKIPPHLHFKQPSTKIDWDRHRIHIPVQSMDWPGAPGPMTAGVSSFGFCGTNAHVVMENFQSETPFKARPAKPVTFKRKRFWVDTSPAAPAPDKCLLPGKRMNLPFSEEIRFECPMGERTLGHLPDHLLFGHLVVAGASHLSMIIEAVHNAFGPSGCTIKEMSLHAPLIIPHGENRTAQLIFSPFEKEKYQFKLVCTGTNQPPGASGDDWVRHAEGRVMIEEKETGSGFTPDAPLSLDILSFDTPSLQEFPPPTPGNRATISEIHDSWNQLKGTALYTEIAELGHHLGPSFRWVEAVKWKGNDIITQMSPPPESGDHYHFHPGFLDSCFQFFCIRGPWMVSAEDHHPDDADSIFVPFSFDRIHVPPPSEKTSGTLYSHVRIRPRSAHPTAPKAQGADLTLYDATGRVLAAITGFTVRRLSAKALETALNTDAGTGIYVPEWVPEALDNAATINSPPLNWLVLGDQTGPAQRIADFLANAHHHVSLVFPGRNPDEVQMPDGTVTGMKELFATTEKSVDRILYLWGVDIRFPEDPGDFGEIYHKGCLSPMHLVQSIAALERDKPPFLTLITRTGRDALSGDVPVSPFQAMLWGMGRVISNEHPAFMCTMVDWTDEAVTAAYINRIIKCVNGDQLTFTTGKCLGLVLKERPVNAAKLSANGQKTCLVTGGCGALGMAVTERMIKRGARHILLTGRRMPDTEARGKIQNLQKTGADIRFIQGDVCSKKDLRRILALIEMEMPPLGGVIHAAGVVDDALLIRQDDNRMARVLEPKVAGSWNLHCLTREIPLDFMVFFSSMSALLGTPGQSAYAAANAFMDELAHLKHREGCKTISINWGGWADMGMAAALDSGELQRMKDAGTELLKPEDALDMMERLISRNICQAAVLKIKWERYGQRYGSSGAPAMIRGLLPKTPFRGTAGKKHKTNPIIKQIQTADPYDGKELLTAYLWKKAITILGFPEDTPQDTETGLFDLGMDSIMALQFREELTGELSLPLASTLVFNYPTIDEIAGHLKDKILPELSKGTRAVNQTKPPEDSEDTGDIKIQESRNNPENLAPDPGGEKSTVPINADDALDDMSEDELADMLEDRLSRLDKWLD